MCESYSRITHVWRRTCDIGCGFEIKSFIRDITHLYVTWLTHVLRMWHMKYSIHCQLKGAAEWLCVTWLIVMWHDSERLCHTIWMRRVACHTYEWVMSHIWMSHVAHRNGSCHTYESVMSHIGRRHVTHINEQAGRAFMTVSTEIATSPKSTGSRNSNSSVSRCTNSNWVFRSIWICSGELSFWIWRFPGV